MVKKRGRLRLVQSQDNPANVFDDLDALREAQAAPVSPIFQGRRRRSRSTGKFAPVPYDLARELGRQRIGGTAWWLLIELDRLNFESGRNPIKLTSATCEAMGITRWALKWALRRLEAAGAITVERKTGRCPLVTLLSYPVNS